MIGIWIFFSPMSRIRYSDCCTSESSINPTKSPTFRSGKTGEWKKDFTDEHKQIFKDIAGDLLIKLGFETNLHW